VVCRIFLLLRTVFPAICNMSKERDVFNLAHAKHIFASIGKEEETILHDDETNYQKGGSWVECSQRID